MGGIRELPRSLELPAVPLWVHASAYRLGDPACRWLEERLVTAFDEPAP